MSMLDSQIKELREVAFSIQGSLGRCRYRRKDVDEMQKISGMLFEAADTIENLRDRLQPVPTELDYIEDKSQWHELFGTPERAARTIIKTCDETTECEACPIFHADINALKTNCSDYDALLEWLRGDA